MSWVKGFVAFLLVVAVGSGIMFWLHSRTETRYAVCWEEITAYVRAGDLDRWHIGDEGRLGPCHSYDPEALYNVPVDADDTYGQR